MVAPPTVGALRRHEEEQRRSEAAELRRLQADLRNRHFAALAVPSTDSSNSSPDDSPHTSLSSPSPSPYNHPSSSPRPSPSPSFFPNIQPGSAIHSALTTLRSSSSSTSSSLSCTPSAQGGSSHNNHFHLHLHNYLSSNSSAVALSARMIACDRALESRRPPHDRLFYDPLAAPLAGPELMEKALNRQREVLERNTRQEGGGGGGGEDAPVEGRGGGRRMGAETDPTKTPRVAIRTRFFDDFLAYVAQRHPLHLRQLCLMGCGMDTRAYRLDCLETNGEVCVNTFELDEESILRYKEAVLSSLKRTAGQEGEEGPPEIRCRRRITAPVDLTDSLTHVVGVKLVEEATAGAALPSPSVASPPTSAASPLTHPTVSLSGWAHFLLTSSPFTPSIPSVWLLEGNLMYLTPEQQLSVLSSLSYLSCLGSFLAFSHINPRALLNIQRSGAAWGVLQSTFHSAFDAAFMQALDDGGWDILRLAVLGGEGANYGRWHAPVYAVDDDEHGVTLYVCAVKVRGMRVAGGREVDQRMDVDATLRFADTPDPDYSAPSPMGSDSSSSPPSLPADDADQDDGPSSSFTSRSLLSPSPSSSLSLRRERIIDSWNARAAAYDALTHAHSLFTTLAHRLIDLIDAPSHLTPLRAIDLACGPGIASLALLSRYPLARVHLVDPSPAMMNLALSHLHPLHPDAVAASHLLRAEDVRVLCEEYMWKGVQVVVCNAAMHLMREEEVYEAVGGLLEEGGSLVYNLWGHAWADTVGREEEESWQWKRLVNQALVEVGEAPYYAKRGGGGGGERGGGGGGGRTFGQLSGVAGRCGLVVDEMVMDEDEVGCGLMIEHQAMSKGWLGGLGKKRAVVLARAKELAREERMRVRTIRVRVTKPA